MMDILGNFGFEPILFAAQVVNFLIILFLLQRFAFKPLLKMLEDRRQTIAEGLKNAEDSRLSLQKALEEETKIIARAQQTADGLITDAKKQSKEFIAQAKVDAKAQIDALVANAQKDLASERARLEKELAVSVAKTAVSLVEKSLSGMIDSGEQEKVMKRFAQKIEKEI